MYYFIALGFSCVLGSMLGLYTAASNGNLLVSVLLGASISAGLCWIGLDLDKKAEEKKNNDS